MTLPVAARIARRELAGGIAGFRVFLACLALGVAAIAAVGTVQSSISMALSEQGATLLGGDAQVSFTYRRATADELAFLQEESLDLSEIIDFRSMAVVGEGAAAQRVLTQVKAVDAAYPLLGSVVLDPPMPLSRALAPAAGIPGAVMDGLLADRLGLRTGDRFRLGLATFRLGARLVREPDGAMAGFLLGPRTILRHADLEGSGLLEPGALYDSRYRLRLPDGTDPAMLQKRAEALFPDRGLRWLDSRTGAPGAERFVERMGSFLVLISLAAMAVGGIGIALAVESYVRARTRTIATLKAVGAEGRTIRAAYLILTGLMAALGIAIGLVLGVGLPMLAGPWIAGALPVQVAIRPDPAVMAQAAAYGGLTAAAFSSWPLGAAHRIRPAALFRDAAGARQGWPGPGAMLASGLALAALLSLAIGLSGLPWLAAAILGGVAGTLALLAAVGRLLGRIARCLAHRLRGWPILRLALSAIGGPARDSRTIVLALGLGLSVLATVGQVGVNLGRAIDRDLPRVAPAFFMVDIQADQIDAFRARMRAEPAVTRLDTAPMLRGVLTRINGQDARTVAGDHWVVRGDRGLTFADGPPQGTRIVAGAWWPDDHFGPPQVSFAAEEAAEIGLKLGDRITVNVLGRDIEATVTSLRAVDFSSAGIGFVMVLNRGALAGAPHTHIATVYAEERAEAQILQAAGSAWPNVTAIPVREIARRVSDMLGAIAAAAALASGVTLVVGAVVLLGAAASGAAARAYEAAVLMTLGATRRHILWAIVLRFLLPGLVAGLVAIAVGAAAGWGVMHVVMDTTYGFAPASALLVVGGGLLFTLSAGVAFAWPAVTRRPAATLRAPE